MYVFVCVCVCVSLWLMGGVWIESTCGMGVGMVGMVGGGEGEGGGSRSERGGSKVGRGRGAGMWRQTEGGRVLAFCVGGETLCLCLCAYVCTSVSACASDHFGHGAVFWTVMWREI